MKRHYSGVVAALIVLAGGSVASACNVVPTAASANGATISASTLNSQLHTLVSTTAGACLLQLETGSGTPASSTGAGGNGTYAMGFAVAVLNNQVGVLLAKQYAASRGITVSPSELVTARSDFESTLDGEISAAVNQSTQQGTNSYCQLAGGGNISGKDLLAGLPADLRASQVLNQAIDEKLLAAGADLSDGAVAAYYAANLPLFTTDCVSRIVTANQSQANLVVAQLKTGTPFADVARARSIDTQTAANGGSLGCNITQSQVKRALQLQTVTAGTPIGPTQDSSSGEWFVYQVISETVHPLAAVTSVVRQELLQSTTNVDRVSKEIVRFARTANVYVNPQYGSWKSLTIVAPVAPPVEYLLASVSGLPNPPTGAPLNLNQLGQSSSTGSSGSTSTNSGG